MKYRLITPKIYSALQSWLATRLDRDRQRISAKMFDYPIDLRSIRMTASNLRVEDQDHLYLHRQALERFVKLKSFDFSVGWRSFDWDVLRSLCPSSLKNLKLSLREPLDCVELGRLLHELSGIDSLGITEIPDRDDFVSNLSIIGDGILSCATLRHLRLQMTNHNRPHDWDDNARFAQPLNIGYHFSMIFSPLSVEKILENRKRLDHGVQNPEKIKPPLQLRVLNLEHIDIPADALTTTINPSGLEELRITHSQVEASAWQKLKASKLKVLVDVSYNHLRESFLEFLTIQDKLEVVTFARPQDVYREGPIVLFESERYLLYELVKEAPHLGRGSSWYKSNSRIVPREPYPALKRLFMAMQGKPHLKHLRLPADMYDISKAALQKLCSIRSLEHLEFCFDYRSEVSFQRRHSCHLIIFVFANFQTTDFAESVYCTHVKAS